MEVRQETDYVLNHAQKILAIYAAMRDLARQLREAGHRVHYLAIDDACGVGPKLLTDFPSAATIENRRAVTTIARSQRQCCMTWCANRCASPHTCMWPVSAAAHMKRHLSP